MEVTREKNLATRIMFPLISISDHVAYFTGTTWAGLTNETITARSFNDDETNQALTIAGVPVEVAGTGEWELALTATEMNPDTSAHNYVLIKLNADEIDEQTILINLKLYSTIAFTNWEEILTGATHNVPTSAGKRLRDIEAFGYELAAIWIDTVNGTAGSADFENGTIDNPVNNIADALILAASLNISRFVIQPNSSITFAANMDGFALRGEHWTLALGGQSFSNGFVQGADISGICTGVSSPKFEVCQFLNVTLPPSLVINCGIGGDIIGGSAGQYDFHNCYSQIAGSNTPSFDFGAAVVNTDLNLRDYSGGMELRNMGGAGTDLASIDGNGQVIFNINCSGGTLELRGNFHITDNASAAVALIEKGNITSLQGKSYGAQAYNRVTDSNEGISDKIGVPVSDVSVDIATNLTAINSVQNNTTFVSIPPSPVVIPMSGDNIIKVTCTIQDTDGNPEDPDTEETVPLVGLLARAVNAATDKTAWFDDEAGSTSATASSTYGGNFVRMVKESTGQFSLYYKLPSTENVDNWVFTFKYKEATVQFIKERHWQVVLQSAAALVTLDDTDNNKTVIAKAIRNFDSDTNLGATPSAGAIEKGIRDKTDPLPADPASETNVDAAETAILAAITALNDVSAGDILTQVDNALDAANVALSSIPNFETGSLRKLIQLLGAVVKGEKVETSTIQTILKEDGATPFGTRTINTIVPGTLVVGELT